MKVLKAEGVFKDLGPTEIVWMSHGDSVKELPPGYEVIGESPGENAAIANFSKNFYGFQFHVEVVHTVHGMKILKNFLDLCGVSTAGKSTILSLRRSKRSAPRWAIKRCL